jgi:hypothetical protein
VVQQAEIIAASRRGMSDLYVALTRATQRLGVVHTGELPEVLHSLRPYPELAEEPALEGPAA